MPPDTFTHLLTQPRYPNNFVIGSDVVGRYDGYEETVRRYDALLLDLGPDLADKVGRENLVSIMPKDGITLDPGYIYPEHAYTGTGN